MCGFGCAALYKIDGKAERKRKLRNSRHGHDHYWLLIFVRNLSEQSRFFRFMRMLQELTPEMLARFTQIDYDREMAFFQE